MSGLLKLSASLLPRSLPGAVTLVRIKGLAIQNNRSFDGGFVPVYSTPTGGRLRFLARGRSAARVALPPPRPRTRNSYPDGTRNSFADTPGLENLALPWSRAILKEEKENRSSDLSIRYSARITNRDTGQGHAGFASAWARRNPPVRYVIFLFVHRRRGARHGGSIT